MIIKAEDTEHPKLLKNSKANMNLLAALKMLKQQNYGRHAVDYKGYREGKGIWGNWTLANWKGGFHIWPLSEGPTLQTAEETDEKPEPAVSPVP